MQNMEMAYDVAESCKNNGTMSGSQIEEMFRDGISYFSHLQLALICIFFSVLDLLQHWIHSWISRRRLHPGSHSWRIGGRWEDQSISEWINWTIYMGKGSANEIPFYCWFNLFYLFVLPLHACWDWFQYSLLAWRKYFWFFSAIFHFTFYMSILTVILVLFSSCT